MKLKKELQEGCEKMTYFKALEEELDLTLLQELDQANRKDIVREYVRYAVLPSLSEIQIERMTQILNLAQEDIVLDFWISEADHFLDHKLGLWDPEYDRDQQSKLEEFLSVQFDDPLFDQSIQDDSKELQSRISAICSSTVCELDTSVPVSVLIKFPKPLITSDAAGEVHSKENESVILMDISLACEDTPTLTLGSTSAENEKTLEMWIEQLPQPYGDIVEANKFIHDKRFSSDEEVKFFSSSNRDAIALKEAISFFPCPLDNKPLVNHRFRVVSSPQLSRLSSRMN